MYERWVIDQNDKSWVCDSSPLQVGASSGCPSTAFPSSDDFGRESCRRDG